MSIIKSNIVQMWRTKHSFFLVVIFVQAIAAFSVLYVTGAIANDYFLIKEDSPTNMDINISLNITGDNPVHYSEIKDMVFEITNDCLPGIAYDTALLTHYTAEYGQIMSIFNVEGDRYLLTDTLTHTIQGKLIEGRIFTEEELNAEKCYAVVSGLNSDELIIDGQKIEIVGRSLDMIGIPEIRLNPYVYETLDLEVSVLDILLNRIITEDEFGKLTELLDETLPGNYRIGLETSTEEDKIAILKSSLVTSSLIGVSVLAVLLIVYGYIIRLRKKNLAIWRLTGCSSIKAAGLFFTEMGIISAPSVLLGFIVFYFTQIKWLNKFYPYMEVTHTAELYVKSYVAMMLALFVLFAGISVFNSRYSVKQQLIRADI